MYINSPTNYNTRLLILNCSFFMFSFFFKVDGYFYLLDIKASTLLEMIPYFRHASNSQYSLQ